MRLFIAVDIPRHIKEQVADICFGIQGVRWVPMEQLHCTLHFLGDIRHDTFECVDQALSHIHASPFSIQLKGVGYFPPRKKPRVLWVGVQHHDDISLLHTRIDLELGRAGIEIEKRKFHPHITVARLRQDSTAQEITPFLEQNALFETESIAITDFHLYSSTLRPHGAEHNREVSYQLSCPE